MMGMVCNKSSNLFLQMSFPEIKTQWSKQPEIKASKMKQLADRLGIFSDIFLTCSIHFHFFSGGAENVARSRIIENLWISLHFHYFFGDEESVGRSRIIETHMDYLYIFIISLVEQRAWEAPESLKTNGFLYISIIFLVERTAWEAPKSSKTYRFFVAFPLFLLWSGERGKLQNH